MYILLQCMLHSVSLFVGNLDAVGEWARFVLKLNAYLPVVTDSSLGVCALVGFPFSPVLSFPRDNILQCRGRPIAFFH
jgi:hypothetical protein